MMGGLLFGRGRPGAGDRDAAAAWLQGEGQGENMTGLGARHVYTSGFSTGVEVGW